MHHLVKGQNKGNYNIILPGGDYLLGTYNSCVDNRDYCKIQIKYISIFVIKKKNKM